MKKTLLFLFGIFNFLPSAYAADPLPPKIQVLAPVYDFGTVAEGTRVKHDFEVANVGGTELIIQQVVAACGCTAAVSQDSKVAPGGKTVVHVEFDSTGFSGEKTKEARINSNDPVNPSVFISLKGVVENEVAIHPARIQFGEFVSAPETVWPETQVKIQTKGAAQISAVAAGSSALVVSEIKQGASEWSFIVKPAEGTAPGDIRDRVIVSITRGGEKREISIPVMGRVIGPIVAKPSTLAMGIIEGDKPIERRLQIESRRKATFSISSIESDHPAISVTQKTIEAGKNVVLAVSVDPRKVNGDLRSTITIHFDDQALMPLQLSVYGVRPPSVE